MKHLALALALLGCAACSETPPSTVTGSVDAASFPGVVTRITAIDSEGVVAHGTIASDGAFNLPLPSQDAYRLYLEVDGSLVPVATRSSASGYGSVVGVQSDGAAVDMGRLRYASLAAVRTTIVGMPVLDACVDGVGSRSGDACIGAEAAVDCSAVEDAGGEHDHDGGHHGRGHRDVDGDRDHGGDRHHGLVVEDVLLQGVDGVAVPENALPLELSCGMVGGC